MATMVAGKANRQNSYGFKVERAAAVLPATAAQTIFTVTGRVFITALIGEVTTVCSATVTNLKIDAVGTASGVTTPLVLNSLVTSLTVGNEFAFSTLGAVATIGAAVSQNNEAIMPTGIIRITTDATNTGAMRWTCLYIPLDDGANVVFA
jgi:hypothetical protein